MYVGYHGEKFQRDFLSYLDNINYNKNYKYKPK
jgi:hypothetical protein